MAAPPRPGSVPGTDLFDAYFRRADLDRDGRISGAEAVAFCQGSNLPKPVLAQIWTYADHNRTGFLGRQEFYNMLKLITVAQSGRSLTPDMVKSALFGPAAAKIPAPQINPASPSLVQMNLPTTTTQTNSLLSSSTQLGATGPNASQSLGFKGTQAPATAGTNQQFLSSNSNFMRPPQATPASASLFVQGVNPAVSGVGSVAGPRMPGSNQPNLSSDWLGGRTGGVSVGGTPQVPARGVSPSPNSDGFGLLSATVAGAIPKSQAQSVSTSSVLPNAVESISSAYGPKADAPKALVASGNGFSSDSIFGGNAFSATSQAKPDASSPNFSASSMASPSNISSAPVGSQSFNKAGQLDPRQSTLAHPSGGSQLSVSTVSPGPASSATIQSQLQWPKFNQSDIRKYTTVFMEVDKDRDGKITGEQARNLFLSWRLPREVLKQVWDLSDQDNDSMLSLREFCIALYLMERYREGRPLPAVLPNTVKYDEALLQATSQSSTAYGGPGFSQPSISGSHPVMPSTGMRPPVQTSIPSHIDGAGWLAQQKSRGPVLENHTANELNRNEQSAVNSKNQEAKDEGKKVQQSDKILDSREKLEFYRTKMQELVLYKSRCDNRLNEITERASADKREVESLGKKYEEKYKQVGELASILAVEEAKFRDIQARKLELQNAIVKMEEGGSADGLLQVRVDRIQSDLEELEKALNERCKQKGLRVKPATAIELPFGWEPGTQEGAADWDDDWDKFEDEGFTVIKDLTDLTIEVDDNVSTANPKSPSVWSDKASTDEFSPVATSSNVDSKNEKFYSSGERINGVAYDHSEEVSERSPPSSPGRSSFESPFHSTQFGMHDNSPRTKESHSDHGGAESIFSADKYTDEPSWTFDDTDSVWGSSAINTKEMDHERSPKNDFFMSGDLGLNPIKVYSPSAASVFGKERKSPFFEDSVPSSPMFNYSASPKFSGQEDYSFNSFGRFDSFKTDDSGFFPPHDSSARFDSFRITHGAGMSRFDSTRSTQGVGLSRFDSIRSTQGANHTRFDSSSSPRGFGHSRAFESFDDADPFGSTGPFKASTGHSPRQGSDKWSAF